MVHKLRYRRGLKQNVCIFLFLNTINRAHSSKSVAKMFCHQLKSLSFSSASLLTLFLPFLLLLLYRYDEEYTEAVPDLVA